MGTGRAAMSGLRKGVTYTFQVEWADGRSTTALAQTVEQAERIANRKRFRQAHAPVPITQCHATNDDRPSRHESR
jgi:hypothetical protein